MVFIKDSLQIYKIMYNKGQVPFCLKRKKNVFDEYIKIISSRSSTREERISEHPPRRLVRVESRVSFEK